MGYLINFQRYFKQENILFMRFFFLKNYFRDFLNCVFSLSRIIVAVNIVSLREEEEVWKVKGLRKMQQERPISITEKQSLRAGLGKTKLFYCKSPLLSQVQ